MRYLQQKTQSLSPEFLLLLLLLFWIPVESTMLGRAYTFLVDLNSASLERDMSTVYVKWLLLFTIAAPLLIAIITRPSLRPPMDPPGPMRLVRFGIATWMTGAVISTLANLSDPHVVLDAAAAIISGGMVFLAVRRVDLDTPRHYELACRAILFGALIPCLIDLYRYYAAWGIPSLTGVILNKYKPEFWSSQCYFGNPDNASAAYGLFAMLAIGVLSAQVFRRSTRLLAIATLLPCSLEVVLTMARTGIVFLAFALLLGAIYSRRKRVLIVIAAVVLALSLAATSSITEVLAKYFQPAVTYDTQNSNTESRVESMEDGWKVFENHLLTGFGTGQTGTVMSEDVPHELAIWEASEDGIFGLIGVLLIMAGCIWRLSILLWVGPRSWTARLDFAFFLAPGLYFVRGLVSNVAVSNTVFNTWICITCAMLAISGRALPWDSQTQPDDVGPRVPWGQAPLAGWQPSAHALPHSMLAAWPPSEGRDG